MSAASETEHFVTGVRDRVTKAPLVRTLDPQSRSRACNAVFGWQMLLNL